MKNRISILYLKTNNHTDEKISVGLFAMGEKMRYFSYSPSKIRVANNIIDSNIESSILKTLKTIKNDVDHFNNSPIHFSDFGLNEGALNYLNTYSKGILEFEKLKPIALEINEESFDRIFHLFVDSTARKETTVSFSKRVSKKLSHKAFDKVDKRYSINKNIIHRYAEHKVDFIGKNGSILVGQTLDFSGRPETIDRSILEFSHIVRSLSKFSSELNLPSIGTYNLYISEPDSKENKALLDLVNNDKDKAFKLLTLDKLDDITNTIENGDYMKFSAFIEGLGEKI